MSSSCQALYLCALLLWPACSTSCSKLCKHNLTAPSECGNTHCVIPPTSRPQGSGWVQGDLSAAAFCGPRASLLLAANSTGLPPLTVLVRRVDAGVTQQDVLARGTLTADGAGGDMQMALNLTVDISSWPVGEYTVAVTPDKDSLQCGWCGQLRRFLRKADPSPAATRPPVLVRLRIDQPVLFLDDFFVATRVRTARTLVPAVQERIVNDSFCAASPHPWMKIDRPPKQACTTCPIQFGCKVNYAKAISPLDDPESDAYDCSGALNETARDGSRVWSCAARHAAALAPSAEGPAPSWPPPSVVSWPIASTFVRHYAAADGPVDMAQVSVFYTYGSDSGHEPTVINKVSFAALSGTPIWQRLHGDTKQTLVLPVDGVAGRPLLHAGTPPSQLKHPNVTCRDPVHCQCAGPNITDIGCSNDNFGGSWLLPPDSGLATTRRLTFVYSQARRISAFAPHCTAYDNLAQERRILVTWRTTDGLSWKQDWWEAPPTGGRMYDGALPRDPEPVSEHYGAVNFCVERGQTVRSGCRPTAADGSLISSSGSESSGSSYSPIMSWVMPYDARRQQFWLDLAFSTDGLHFHLPEQEEVAKPATAIANGRVDEWNGGILMGLEPVDMAGTEAHGGGGAQWTDALLPYADSGAHFMFGMRELANFTAEAVQAWGEKCALFSSALCRLHRNGFSAQLLGTAVTGPFATVAAQRVLRPRDRAVATSACARAPCGAPLSAAIRMAY